MIQKKRIIGKYQLVEELASGAFGRVYRAEDTSQNNRIVALKLMHTAHLDSFQERDSFLREAQFLKLLKHPHILPILDADIEDEFPYLVTEYAQNGSLHDRLKKQASCPLSIRESLEILAQVGQALSYAHQQNIIHRDLKPANILFDANGDVLLADFGIATALATSVRSGTAVGTPLYMAPEQFRGIVSKEADQYSLGCIAYELLTRRVPFTAPDFFSLGYKHMSEQPVPPSQLNLLVSPSVEDAVLTALAKQRSERHASVDAFMHALGVAASFTPISAPSSAPITPTSHVEMPQSVSQWVKAFSMDDVLGEGRVTNQHEESEPAFSPTGSGPNWRVEERTGKTPIVVASPGRLTPSNPASTNMNTSPLQLGIDKEEMGQIEQILSTTAPLPIGVPDGAASAPLWPAIPDTSGLFNPTTTPLRKRHLLKTSRGLVVMASLAVVLLVLLSNGIYILLETPYPKKLATAVKTHNIAQLVQPVVQATTKPTVQPTAKPKVQATTRPTSTKQSSVVVITSPTPSPISGGPPSTPVPATASVTITPATQNVSPSFTVDAVMGTPSGSQVQARQITATGQQGFTATATGQGTNPATYATGNVTLSSTSTTAVTVPTGTAITDTTGTLVFVTLQDAPIPAVATGQQYATYDVTVQAQVAGTSGDIAAQAINGTCCTGTAAGITAINNSAFTGGADAQTYTYLQQSDIDSADASVITSLESSVSASLPSQMHSNEQAIGNANCTPTVTTASPVNSQVASTTGTVSVTCTQEVYDAQGAQAKGAASLQQQVNNQGYSLTSQIGTSITGASIIDSQGTVAVTVNTSATERYVFTNAREQQIAAMLAGKSASQAQSLLKSTSGVAGAIIRLSGTNGDMLPTNASSITVTTTS